MTIVIIICSRPVDVGGDRQNSRPCVLYYLRIIILITYDKIICFTESQASLKGIDEHLSPIQYSPLVEDMIYNTALSEDAIDEHLSHIEYSPFVEEVIYTAVYKHVLY